MDPRDIEKREMFNLWIEDQITLDPDSAVRLGDLWGAYLAWITMRDAEYFYGRNRFVEKMEARGLGHEDRRKHSRWYVGVRTRKPLI